MIRADMIPDEVVEAAAIALHARWVIICVQDGGDPLDYERWEGLEDDEKQGWRQEARASIIAALQAWPERWLSNGMQNLVLPLPQKEKGGQ